MHCRDHWDNLGRFFLSRFCQLFVVVSSCHSTGTNVFLMPCVGPNLGVMTSSNPL